MERIWYIQIKGKTEGPYSLLDLKQDVRLSPDSLVWREGFLKWLPMRDVPELQEVFADERTPSKSDEDEEPEAQKEPDGDGDHANKLLQDEIVLRYSEDFPPFWLWLFIVFCLLVYVFYYLQKL